MNRWGCAATHTAALALASVNAFWNAVWPGANGGNDGNAAVPTMKAMTTGEQDHLDRGCIATAIKLPFNSHTATNKTWNWN